MVSVNRFPAGDINGRGVSEIYGTKALRVERARARARALATLEPLYSKTR